jgi:hypothetical protein
LQDAVDAAIRYSSTGLQSGPTTVRARAKAAALENKVLGAPLELMDGDIQLGTWDSTTRTFSLLTGASESTANAVRITAYRTNTRGTPILLTFGSLIGINSFDLQITATARYSAAPVDAGFGVTGREKVFMENNSIIDSYDSSSGAYSSSLASNNADVKSNSTLEMKNNAQVRGSANPGTGQTVQFSNNASVTGSTLAQTSETEFESVNTATVAASNNNSSLPSAYFNSSSRKFVMDNNSAYTLPAGTYYFDDIELKNNAKLSLGGEVTIYTTGKLEIQNNAYMYAYDRRPGNLRIFVTDDSVILKNNAKLDAYLYAPDSKLEIENNAELSGAVVAEELLLKNNAKIHQDSSITGGAGGTSASAVTVVQ